MTTFDTHEAAAESKLAHDEELKFKATVRRNKWLGLWAAEKLGLSEAAAEDYATDLIAADLEENGEEEVFRIIRTDFDKAGIAQSDQEIRSTMEALFASAVEEIKTVAAEAKESNFGKGAHGH